MTDDDRCLIIDLVNGMTSGADVEETIEHVVTNLPDDVILRVMVAGEWLQSDDADSEIEEEEEEEEREEAFVEEEDVGEEEDPEEEEE